MSNIKLNDGQLNLYGHLLSRVVFGLLLVAHGIPKVLNLDGTVGFFSLLGLPGFLAYPVAAIEVFGGLLIAIGYHARWASLATVPVLLGATWAHSANGWVFSSAGGGWEFPLLLAVLAIVHALSGDGPYALRSNGKFAWQGEEAPA